RELQWFFVPTFKPGTYLAFGPCPTDATRVGSWSFSLPLSTYSSPSSKAKWVGRDVPLQNISDDPNALIINLPDRHQEMEPITNFDTKDKKFSCLDGTNLPVYTAANEFPNLYLVQGVCPETHASGTWFFKYPFQYSARWQDQLVQLTIDPEQETLPAGSEDLHTQIREFRTDDPDYQCMSKLFLEAYHAPQNPNQVVAVFHCLEGNPAP